LSPVILGVGLCTPVGLSAVSAQRAMVAGINAFSDTGVDDEEGQPVRASHHRALSPDLDRTARVGFLAERAVEDCLVGVAAGHAPPIKAFVALAEADLGRGVSGAEIVTALKRKTAHLPVEWERPVLAGPAGFFHALTVAAGAVASGAAALALVGAADSNCDPASLRALVKARRVLNRQNRDGSIPGEGAGFVLIARGPMMGLQPIGKIVASAVAPNEGTLGPLFQQLHAAGTGGVRPDHLFACQRADRAAGRALLEAYFRAPRLMPEPFRMTLSAEAQGDSGVAAGAVELGVLLHRFSIAWRRAEPLRSALICAAGDGSRAAGALISVA
jgi:3-oxoacyl-[acyl-carrier-protein] synthase-1